MSSKLFHIRSIYNLHLGVTPDHQLYAHQNRCDWERIRVTGPYTNATLGGWNDWFITVDQSGNLSMTPTDSASTRWEIINTGSLYQFRSVATNRYLTLGTGFWNRQVTTVTNSGLGTYFAMTEPTEVDIMFQTASVPCGQNGLSINIPTKAPGLTWGDNFICSTVGKPPLVWCYNQQQVAAYQKQGFSYFPLTIPGDPVFKSSVGFCLPKACPYDFKFVLTEAEAPALITAGYILTELREIADPTMNVSMWLGYKRVVPRFSSTDQIGYKLQVWSGGWQNSKCTTAAARVGMFRVDINGTTVISDNSSPWRSSRGLNIAVIDPSGKILSQKAYDTHASASQSDSFKADLISQCTNVSDDRIIIVGTFDEASESLNDNARDIMMLKGAGEFSLLGLRGSYLFVFRPRDNSIFYEKLNNCGDVTTVFDCGVKCSAVFDPNYYSANYKDLTPDPTTHWTTVGINEGRRGIASFDPVAYYNINDDLQTSIGKNYSKLARHYVEQGRAEGRISTMYTPAYAFGGLLTNNLVCYLDANTLNSNWKDLSGNNNNFTFTKGPVPVTDGLIAYDVPQINGPSVTRFKISADNNRGGYTVVIVGRCKMANAASTLALGNINISIGPKLSFSSVTQDLATWDKEHMFTFVRTATNRLDIYLDGKRLVKGPIDTVLPNGNVTVNSGGKWCGDLKMLMIYNYGLPADQIKAMYDWYTTTSDSRLKQQIIQYQKLVPSQFPVSANLQIYLSCTFSTMSGNGKTVSDLSGHKRDFTFTKTPQIQESAWVTDGTNMLTGPPSSSVSIQSDGNYTIFVRCKTNVVAPNSVLKFYGWGKLNRAIFMHPSWENRTLYYDQGGCCDDNTRIQYPIANTYNKMTTYVLNRSDRGRNLYINGTLVFTTKNRGSDMHFNSTPMELMGSKEFPWQGALSDFLVFNRDLTDIEIQSVYKYINNPYRLINGDWNAASQMCTADGLQLATNHDLCFGGRATDPSPFSNALAPVGPDQWLDLTTCIQQKRTGPVPNAHVKCVPFPKDTSVFNTAFVNGSMVYFIKGKTVLKYNLETSESVISSLSKEFPELPPPFSMGSIDSAFLSLKGILYLTYEQTAVQYDFFKHAPIGTPGDITQVFPGLTGYFGKGYIDAIAAHYTAPGSVYLFKSNRFCYYNLDTNRAGATHVINSSSSSWNSLPITFRSGAFSAVIKYGQIFYFFKEDQYFNYATRLHGNITPDWPGMKPPFVKEQQRCVALAKYRPVLDANVEKYRNTDAALYKTYSDRLQRLTDEENKHCNYVSMNQITDRLQKEQQRLQKIRDNLENTKKRQILTKQQTVELNNNIKSVTSKIADINMQIIKQKNVKCPVGETCNKPQVSVTKPGKCDSDMIKELLKSKGYTDSQIEQLENVLKLQSNGDIRKHPDYYKYVDKSSVKQCKQGLADPDVVKRIMKMADETMQQRTSPILPGQPSLDSERKALQILKEAILEYGKTAPLKLKVPEKVINSANSAGELTALKKLQDTLQSIRSHPKYIKIAQDISSLNAVKKADKQKLTTETVPSRIAKIHQSIQATNEALKKKTIMLEKFHGRL